MAQSPDPGGSRGERPVDHLTVRADGGPNEVMFAFGAQSQRLAPAFLTSAALDILVVVTFILLSRYGPALVTLPTNLPEELNKDIVWIAEPGPGGGGGGGGNRMPDPPKQAQLPGKDKITVPVAKPPEIVAPPEQKKEEPPPVMEVNIPAKMLAAANDTLPGAIEAPPGPPTLSQGSGTGGGAGTGTGTGLGPGTGSGLGPGTGGGTGGGAYRPGNGVTTPVLLQQVKPNYTSDAMRAKVQGTVWLQCVVLPDGTIGDIRVTRSLDAVFGLDQEAIKAARQWRFRPGTRMGQPVPVEIVIELAFSLR